MCKKIFFIIVFIVSVLYNKQALADGTFSIINKEYPTLLLKDSGLQFLTTLSVQDIKKLVGRRLTFKERLALKLYKHHPKWFQQNVEDSTNEKRQTKKALWAKWLGIGSLVGLLIPGVNILSFPAAIVALILGIDTINKVKDKSNSRQGIIFGSITLALFIIAILLVLAIIYGLGR